MKITKSLLASILAACCLAFTACSDDDDNNKDSGVGSGVNPEQVFTAGIPTQVGDLTITTGPDGRVTKIVEDAGTEDEYVYSFKYITSRTDVSVPYDVVMSVNGKDGGIVWVFYIGLNEQGFAKYAYQVYYGRSDEWRFEYNENGQLSRMKRSEGDNEVTTITYDANGDIVKVDVTDDEHNNDSFTISYTNSAVTTALANKGAIMLFDDLFSIDMDEFGPAYYAGLLGKATAHLPVEKVDSWIDDNGATQSETTSFKWTLNDNGLPASLVESENGYDENPVFFNWY